MPSHKCILEQKNVVVVETKESSELLINKNKSVLQESLDTNYPSVPCDSWIPCFLMKLQKNVVVVETKESSELLINKNKSVLQESLDTNYPFGNAFLSKSGLLSCQDWHEEAIGKLQEEARYRKVTTVGHGHGSGKNILIILHLTTKQLYSSLSQPRPGAQELNSKSEPMEVMYSLIELEEDSEPIEATTSFIVSNEDVTTLPVAEANNLVVLPIENLDISKEETETVVSLENNERQTITNSVPKNTQKRKYQI
ncbi:hypothetical protein DAPPUDRAFT_330603 [Daphnia pulex]|uniref:Uncharacterized protein n=1 Tax=Daphnia pulex TaxID=6669 RepID=E9HK28_DAPPU|nr:hypothetical protein DAPPUDRAFT_330603 [Daphnia pulex]|eukprot:EFX67919.1 hypothetical protein DAPPUDRAFT_330603 [Daphnia pulex]